MTEYFLWFQLSEGCHSHPAQTSAGSAVSSAIPTNTASPLETTDCQFCLHLKKINPITLLEFKFHDLEQNWMSRIWREFCVQFTEECSPQMLLFFSIWYNLTTMTCAKRKSSNDSFSTHVRQAETQNRGGCMSNTAEVTLLEALQLKGWDHSRQMCWLYLQVLFQGVLRFNCPKVCETFRNPSSAKYKRMLVSGTVVMHLLLKLRACKGVQIHEIWINIFPFCSSLEIEPRKYNTPP